MDLLLDTRVLLWWDQDSRELSEAARSAIADPDNRVFVSAASPWEITIKARKGKLRFKGKAAALIGANGFLPLAIDPVDGEAAGMLEWAHSDPFDRVLVAQALRGNLVLAHADTTIRAFGDVMQLWARRTEE